MGSAVQAAALAGLPLAIQRRGIWIGRRQLFVRFAGQAETAQMYTDRGLARTLVRMLESAKVHSICVSGRDPLANAEFLVASLGEVATAVPVMLDSDGQRPEALALVHPVISMFQITLEPPLGSPVLLRAMESMRRLVELGREHALTIAGTDHASDADYLQIIEHAHQASPGVPVVIHPGPAAERQGLEQRWSALLGEAVRCHADVRVVARLAGASTMI
jgi:organic radical activating enzyme